MFGADFGATGTGFGVGTPQDVEELNKALSTSGTNAYSRGGDLGAASPSGSPLRPESLESTLKVTTYGERHIVFWKDIPKLPAFNTVEEFNQLNAYGNQGGAFVPEGISPEASDSSYARKVVQVKYLGTQRQVTHVMTLVRPAHGDVIALETLNGTRELLRKLEQALFDGDSSCNTYEWDGMYKQLTAGYGAETGVQNIIDMQGQPLDEKTLGEAARVIIDNYGFPTSMYCGYSVLQDLNQLFFPKERLNMLGPSQAGPAGFALQQFQTVGGMYDFRPSVFLKPGRDAPTAIVGVAASVPNLSGVTFGAGAPGADAASKMPASSQVYSYTLENRFGETVATGAVTVVYAAGQSAILTVGVIPNGVAAGQAAAVNLFRKVTGAAGAAKWMRRIPVTSATVTFTDQNLYMPGTSRAYLLQVDLDVMSFKQLAPFTKIPLATIDPSIRWMQLLYGTPAVYMPLKNTIITNIGKA